MDKPNQIPITGREDIGELNKPTAVLTEFYKAFNGRDFNLVESNWLNTAEAAMSNPLGGVKRGWADIRTVYQKIFAGPADVYVEFYDYTIVRDDRFFQAVGRERGTLTINDRTIDLAIRTSRVYVVHDGRYRQLHHHGSIEDPSLLSRYQNAVISGVVE